MELIEGVGSGHGLRGRGFWISCQVGGPEILSRFNSLDAFGRIGVAETAIVAGINSKDEENDFGRRAEARSLRGRKAKLGHIWQTCIGIAGW